MLTPFVRCLVLWASAWALCGSVHAEEAPDRQEVVVSGPTRLDWTFALANQSVVDPPAEWLADYESTQQRYELFVPLKGKDRKTGHPLVLFISAGDGPAGWGQLEAVCRSQGILFASPHGAGNNTPMPRRVRIVLDVLDDIRRSHPVDPDRTYLAGFSGGGRVACAITFSLPELFGGVMPVCAGGELREEPWLRHRAIDRLSLGFVTGTNDFNVGEVSRFCGPMLAEMGIRTKVTVVPNLGHGIPDGKALAPVLEWLDQGVAARRKFATKYPASRIAGDRAPSRDDWANGLLAEGQLRIKQRATTFSGLMQLQGVMHRWPDLPAGEEAKRILLDYESLANKPWEADDIAEQRRFLIARARGVDAYGSGDLPEVYLKQRTSMLKAAIDLWGQVITDGQDDKAVAEAKQRIPVLTEMLDGCGAQRVEAERVEAGEPLAIAAEVLRPQQREDASGMIERDIVRRTDEVNARNREAWAKIQTRADWEQFRDERIEKLRQSLAEFPAPPKTLNVRTTGVVPGDGFRIENVVYESRPGLWVTANLYVPAVPKPSMPGILIAHAHHRDKPQSELQDMGMTWARAGCLVLVIDQVGYGERRSHPFHRESDFAKPFAVSRQDYHFRYDVGVQLQLLGDSLMGWMVWDLSRGVALLLSREGVDPQRIILLGAVAGGGDPAGVTAALDPRIKCCVPFNFGGPQPESKYPLPEDSETSFNYLAGSYWESTRGLRLGGRDDFLHWVIVGSTAPRYLVHAHEFSWDGAHDPVWKRYQKIWGDFYQASDRIGVAHGHGLLRQSSEEASHCTNIGPAHRKMIHPLFQRWFEIQVTPDTEYSQPRSRSELISMTDAARQELHPQSLTEVMSHLAQERITRARQQLAGQNSVARRRTLLQSMWSKLLGPIGPSGKPVLQSTVRDAAPPAGMSVERVVLEVEPGIVVPLLLLMPEKQSGAMPVVLGLAQAGKAGFLQHRSHELRQLVDGGAVVVLPDLRGTGESRSGSSRGKESEDTNLSCNVLLFGETLVGQRLRDLRSVIAYLRDRPEIDTRRLALWGDSFTPPNPSDTHFQVPHGVDGWPRESEPVGGLLAALGALFEDDVRAVSITGGLVSYRSVLTHSSLVIPHDAAVPGALTAGDLSDLVRGLSPRAVRLAGMVDHLNRRVSLDDLKTEYSAQPPDPSAPEGIEFSDDSGSTARWLLDRLK